MGKAAVLSFLIVLLLGPFTFTIWSPRTSGLRHPTMGGVLIVMAIFVWSCCWPIFRTCTSRWPCDGGLAGDAGSMDHRLKLRQATQQGRRNGLKVWEKLIFQIGLSVLLSVFMYKYGGESRVLNGAGESSFPAHNFYIPFIAAPLVLLRLWTRSSQR